MDREQLIDDLALALDDLLPTLTEGVWYARTQRAVELFPELATTLWSITLLDVVQRALVLHQGQARRAAATLPPETMPEVRRAKVLDALAERGQAEELAEVVSEGAEVLMSEPPGGRGEWVGFWPGDRRHDALARG